ncbi:hypothetical protein Ddc_15949 [Ditylenchus destructor]|nr:hypothetical protein Ddc_15949 [Ditylenchus destructor]
MSSVPNEIFGNITNFLPNDDITDLMLLSRTFNAHVTPRLRRINEDRTTMNQTIESFETTPTSEDADEWVAQLNLKRFEPIGSVAKKRMKELLVNIQEFEDCFHKFNEKPELDIGTFDRIKQGMSLERFDDAAFLHIMFAFVSTPEFCQETRNLVFRRQITSGTFKKSKSISKSQSAKNRMQAFNERAQIESNSYSSLSARHK